MWKLSVLLLALTCSQVLCDVYMHNPRGSNNRLNEQNAERNNGNRLFDSQNNNRGGYNVGDKTNNAATDNTNTDSPSNTYDADTITTAQQYQMVYYEGSILQIEWTAQHGCGGNEINDPHMQNCNIVIQYTCDIDAANVGNDAALAVTLRDGTTTNQVNEDGTDNTRGYHESAQWYKECKNRNRNTGLFTADQTLAGNTAIYTRQNPNNNRRGLECPEERDYYPYWLPTIWRDVAYITDRVDLCQGANSFIAKNSGNNNDKFKCYDASATGTIISKTTKNSCSDAGGSYTSYNFGIDPPACVPGQWTRHNHLGNSRDGQMANYNWTLPSWSELVTKNKFKVYDQNYVKCVVRLRYNISTDDYDPWNTNATSNGNASPVRDNPTIDIGSDLNALKLALNTDQTGRTFQDRSHIFYIRKRPTALATAKIVNLNVRGKRGNIVQTYPAIEYDFVPNRLHVSTNDYVHIQWTGSNTHNNGPAGENAGDGQGGDAGEGTGGTDRSNFVQLQSLSDNFPVALDKNANNLFVNTECWRLDGATAIGTAQPGVTNVDCAIWLATSGYFRTVSAVRGASGANDDLNPTLNNAPASLVGGVVMRVKRAGTFHYACTRNNSFSNRSQKGTLIVA